MLSSHIYLLKLVYFQENEEGYPLKKGNHFNKRVAVPFPISCIGHLMAGVYYVHLWQVTTSLLCQLQPFEDFLASQLSNIDFP
jgi:hypothetical protein